MVRLAKTIDRQWSEVLGAAEDFFGPGGLGLELTGRRENCVSFAGGGGHVAVETCPSGGRTEVIVEAREWEQDARRFLAGL